MQKDNKLFKFNFDRPKNIKNDILSGLTVALVLIPEALAFSFVAKVDPIVGLYAAFMMGMITAIFGGRPGMISGATGAVAVVFAPLMIGLFGDGLTQTEATGYLFATVSLMGVFQMLFGIFKMGKFVRMVPHPVMLGFLNGLAVIIFKSQFEMFQIGHGEHAHWIQGAPLGFMIGLILLTMLISFFFPKWTKAVPATLVAIVTVTGISLILKKFGIHEERTVIDFVKTIAPGTETIAASLPRFQIPTMPFTLANFKLITPFAFMAACVGLVESLMTLTLIDEMTGTRGRSNRECMAQGAANMVNGFFGGMGGCVTLGQSMINIQGGGRGRLSGIAAATFLLIILLFAAPWIELIPLSALVGVMFMLVIGTFEWTSFRVITAIPKADALIIIVVSFVAVWKGNLALAVFVGIIMSALTFAWEKGKHISARTSTDEHGTKVYKLDGPLFFGSSQNFIELFEIANDPTDVVIDFKRARVYDHSALDALHALTEKYAAAEKNLHLLNLSSECRDLLGAAENVVEVSVIEDLEWHIAVNELS